MKVFGIGFHKTGTSTLGRALKILGFNNHKSYDFDLVKKWHNNRVDDLIEEAKKYNNFEDWPWPLIYERLHHEFNGAKFILTVRKDSEKWYNSLHKNSNGPNETRKMIYGGNGDPRKDKERYINFYEEHNKNVKDFFNEHSPDKLITLCWETGNNWEQLCEFLDKPIPNKAFPHKNKS